MNVNFASLAHRTRPFSVSPSRNVRLQSSANTKRLGKISVPLAIALAACPGCGSLGTHLPKEAPGIYAGVRADAGLIAHPSNQGDAVIGSIPPALVESFCIIDLPLSAAMDTLLLPIDLTYRKPDAEKGMRPNDSSR